MDTDLKKIKKITHLMRKEGVLSLKTADIEISLSPHAIQLEEKPIPEEVAATPDKPQYSEDDALFWSSPGYFPETPDQ